MKAHFITSSIMLSLVLFFTFFAIFPLYGALSIFAIIGILIFVALYMGILQVTKEVIETEKYYKKRKNSE